MGVLFPLWVSFSPGIIINDTSLNADTENIKDIIKLTDIKCIQIGYQPKQTPINNQELWQAISIYLTN